MGGELAGRVALVTGATSGIGRAVALRFAKEGAAVALTGRRAKELEDVANEVRSAGGRRSPSRATSATRRTREPRSRRRSRRSARSRRS